MSETLYRKYRPKNFSEIIGQKHIVQTLSNAIKNNRIGQAYLFTGPRGTGKTSVARIFAKAVNCEKLKDAISCEKCQSCQLINGGQTLDIIEIDAASNTGVDNIRQLRETVALPTTALKYKVYIIDEVHMLSTGAFNALLKTLEEPPSHVIFILATTEIHKVPETIISRCQRFDFARLPLPNIIEKLTFVAASEKVKIDKSSLEMIAIAAEGGMRNAESLLAQVMALEDKKITVKEVQEILGATDRAFAGEITKMLMDNDSRGAIDKINSILNDGYDLQIFNKSLINYLRQLMLIKISSDLKSSFAYELTSEELEKMERQAQKNDLLKIITAINLFLDAQNKIASFILPQLPLEIAVIKATNTLPNIQPETFRQREENNQDTRNKKQEIPNSQFSIPNPLRQSFSEASQIPNPNEQISKNIENDNETIKQYDNENAADIDIDKVKSNWNKLLEEIKPYNHSLKALLSNCKVIGTQGNEIRIATAYEFYKDKLNSPENRLTLEKVLSRILGNQIRVKAVTNKEAGISNTSAPAKSPAPGQQNELLNSAMEILGGKVVEE